MKKYELTYEQLYNLFGEGEHEVPYMVSEEIFVKTPTGYSKINEVVCKHNNDVIRLDFEDGDYFECSENHLFSHEGVEKRASDVVEVDTTFGTKRVVEKTTIGKENVFDISIDSPHWYVSDEESGIIHHNTYFTMGIVKKFLDDRDSAVVLYFDSEQAVTSPMFRERGIDTSRVAIFPVATVEEFRHQVLKIVDKYSELPKEQQKPMLIVLDSLGMLSTSKEVNDTAEGKETKDMTRAQLVKATFRVLTLKLGKVGIPLIMTNHTYDSMGSMYPTKEMSGGQGLRYAASTIVFLSKRKDKDGTDVIGNIVHCKLYKGRLTKENKMVDVHISYDSGLNPYYGLLPIAEKHGLVKKVSNKFEFPDGTKAFEKAIYKNPEKYFTKEFMDALEPMVSKEFKYGMGDKIVSEEVE